jgi:hypothetical protein
MARAWSSTAPEDRLQGTYSVYFNITEQLKTAMDELNKELAVDKASIQEKLIQIKV